ncbi:SDR family oxidoreductase [Paenibacillus filicis]|uniref:SDR family oxidoreductase n=1 Tax=Paenibacillus filicis TaxID=669464 RepID=A0ABU9DLC1_9BACL
MTKSEQNEHSRTWEDKRILLLGGTSGVGFATAEAASRGGASVVVVSSRQDRVDAAISRLPRGTEGYAVDLSDEEQVRAFFKRIGEFDHLVFTAGESLSFDTIGEIELAAARQLFDLRYWGAYMAAKYGSGNIRQGGSITLTSGTAGIRPSAGSTVPASICGAVEVLTRALAVELAPIRVNVVCLGLIRTELWDNLPEEGRNALYENHGLRLPAGRVGEPEDAAEAFLYLMREQYSTGQRIVVDGGSILV